MSTVTVATLRRNMKFTCRENIDCMEYMWDNGKRIWALKLYLALNECSLLEAKSYFTIREAEINRPTRGAQLHD